MTVPRWFRRFPFLVLSLLLTITPAFATHGKKFPLPRKHSVIASTATIQGVQPSACPYRGAMSEIMVASFALNGSFWRFAYAPESGVFIFLEYETEESMPVRVWIGSGADDEFPEPKHFENPVTAFPNGPCSILFPAKS